MSDKPRTLEQMVADKMDCELDNFVRRALNQGIRSRDSEAIWKKIAHTVDAARGLLRQRMHVDDRQATKWD